MGTRGGRGNEGMLQDIDSKLERELAAGLDACQEEVMGFMQPVEALTQAQVLLPSFMCFLAL